MSQVKRVFIDLYGVLEDMNDSNSVWTKKLPGILTKGVTGYFLMLIFIVVMEYLLSSMKLSTGVSLGTEEFLMAITGFAGGVVHGIVTTIRGY